MRKEIVHAFLETCYRKKSTATGRETKVIFTIFVHGIVTESADDLNTSSESVFSVRHSHRTLLITMLMSSVRLANVCYLRRMM